jgi:hypothetical protein
VAIAADVTDRGDLCARRTVLMRGREARELTQLPSLQRLLDDLPEVPVVALVGEQADRGKAKHRAAMLNRLRSQMQAHPRGRFATAAGSGTFIPWWEPGLLRQRSSEWC